ncbi:MAG: hypothetical protein ACTHMG_04830 [Sphingomonas sp.]
MLDADSLLTLAAHACEGFKLRGECALQLRRRVEVCVHALDIVVAHRATHHFAGESVGPGHLDGERPFELVRGRDRRHNRKPGVDSHAVGITLLAGARAHVFEVEPGAQHEGQGIRAEGVEQTEIVLARRAGRTMHSAIGAAGHERSGWSFMKPITSRGGGCPFVFGAGSVAGGDIAEGRRGAHQRGNCRADQCMG